MFLLLPSSYAYNLPFTDTCTNVQVCQLTSKAACTLIGNLLQNQSSPYTPSSSSSAKAKHTVTPPWVPSLGLVRTNTLRQLVHTVAQLFKSAFKVSCILSGKCGRNNTKLQEYMRQQRYILTLPSALVIQCVVISVIQLVHCALCLVCDFVLCFCTGKYSVMCNSF